MRFLAFIGSAALVALVALAGHWMTDARQNQAPAPQPTAVASSPPSDTGGGAGGYWIAFVIVVIVALAGTAVWVALRQQRLPMDEPPAAVASGPDPSWPHRWHCILYINGHQAGRDYVEFPAPDNQAMERELVERFLDRHGAGLPAGVRVTARATPAAAERVG